LAGLTNFSLFKKNGHVGQNIVYLNEIILLGEEKYMSQPLVFVSYSHKDEAEKEQLVSQLRVLEKAKLIDLWVDDRIGGGTDWEPAIQQAINQASVAILLISANFLTSDFILGEEVPALLERRQSEGLTVFPVIAKPCTWNVFDWLARMNVRPKNARPIWSGPPHQVDQDLAAIVKEVADMVKPKGGGSSAQNYQTASPKPAFAPKVEYNLKDLRKLLTNAFTDVELRQLCYDTPAFRPVYEQFAAGTGKAQIIQSLLEFSERKGLLDQLLAAARDEAPNQYAEFESGQPEREHIDKLIAEKKRRLYLLQEKAAKFGLSTPPEITIEIEDLEAEITRLKQM
jgi:hypothetical protein